MANRSSTDLTSRTHQKNTFNMDLCEAFIAGNVPVHKLTHPILKGFLRKYCLNQNIPNGSTLRKGTQQQFTYMLWKKQAVNSIITLFGFELNQLPPLWPLFCKFVNQELSSSYLMASQVLEKQINLRQSDLFKKRVLKKYFRNLLQMKECFCCSQMVLPI